MCWFSCAKVTLVPPASSPDRKLCVQYQQKPPNPRLGSRATSDLLNGKLKSLSPPLQKHHTSKTLRDVIIPGNGVKKILNEVRCFCVKINVLKSRVVTAFTYI